MGMGRDFIWDDGRMVQHSDDVLLSCTLETCMILQTNVTPINSISKNKIKQNKIKNLKCGPSIQQNTIQH